MSDTEKLYRIHWKSKITGSQGHGTARLTASVADKVIDEANAQWPDLRHWKEEV